MPELNSKHLLDIAKEQWRTPLGLIISIVLACASIKAIYPDKLEGLLLVACYALAALTLIIIWQVSRRIPRCRRGKVGFAVCIRVAAEEENKSSLTQKIQEDLIEPLKKLVLRGSAGNTFDFIEIPSEIAETIRTQEDAQRLRIKCRSHFFIYGNVKTRAIDGEMHHMFQLDGLVSHAVLPGETSKLISQEFSELLPRRVKVPTGNDVYSLEFTSEWAEIASKYIIGVAAYCSGDLSYAEALYKDVEGFLKTKSDDFAIFKKLKNRIPVRLSEVYETRAALNYHAWTKTRSDEQIDEMGEWLSKIEQEYSYRYRGVLLKTTYLFLKHRNVEEGIALLKKCESEDGTWKYNLAFLYAYKGDLKSSARLYRQASKSSVDPDIISQLEEFICWLLEIEPDKYQLYYSLGLINWLAKGDYKQAVEDFNKFRGIGDESEFEKERQLSSEWIRDITNNHIDG